MRNQVFTGTPTSRRFALCPSTVKAGDPVLLGTVPAFALDDYQSLTGGATFCTNGTFTATVVGSTTHSPYTGHKINPGDALYASGTLDSTTNVTTGLLITADSSDTPFGNLDPSYSSVASAATDASAQIKVGG